LRRLFPAGEQTPLAKNMRFLAARPAQAHGCAACFRAGALPRAKAVPALAHRYAPVSAPVHCRGQGPCLRWRTGMRLFLY
jgi:hypothetical protein